MQLVKGYLIKQYVTGYIKVIWGPDVRQEDLFSTGNIVHDDMSLPKNIRTGGLLDLAYSSVHGWKQISPECMWSTCSSLWRTYVDCNRQIWRWGSVMVWGGISYEGLTDLYVINGRYIDCITVSRWNSRSYCEAFPLGQSVTISFWCRIMRTPILLECAWITLIMRLLK